MYPTSLNTEYTNRKRLFQDILVESGFGEDNHCEIIRRENDFPTLGQIINKVITFFICLGMFTFSSKYERSSRTGALDLAL